jgi:hypothetical protein
MTQPAGLPTQHNDSAYFELTFQPTAELVAVVRKFVISFYDQLLDSETASRVAMATHELLENTLKYSLDGRTGVTITLRTQAATGSLTIRTKNRASTEHLAVLVKLIDEMTDAPDPTAFYLALLRRNANRPSGSGLGLARIFSEAEMKISYQLAGDELTIVAEATVPWRGA